MDTRKADWPLITINYYKARTAAWRRFAQAKQAECRGDFAFICKAVALVVTVCAVFLGGNLRRACAEHPIDVQRLSSEGDHFKALTLYDILPDRRLGEDTHIAAAKSAWALGLIRQSADLFDAILRSESLSLDDRARLTLSRGVIEYQEERYQEAGLFAEKAASMLPPKAPLRARALLLLGQSLIRAKQFATAEEKLMLALVESHHSDRADIALTLGTVQMKIGRLNDAEKSLKAIPVDHSHAADAIRMLAAIAIQSGDSDRGRFWIEKGKYSYSDAFMDSWADFGLVRAAIEADDISSAQRIADEATRRFPPSDTWLILMQAALEQAQWNERNKGPKAER